MNAGPDRLFGEAPERHRRAPAGELVAVDLTACPDCGTPTEQRAQHEGALFFHGGYGATRRTVEVWCPGCPWFLTTDISEERP